MNAEAFPGKPIWQRRLHRIGALIASSLVAYGEMVVTSHFEACIYGNQDPIDVEVAEFARQLPDYYREEDWE